METTEIQNICSMANMYAAVGEEVRFRGQGGGHN